MSNASNDLSSIPSCPTVNSINTTILKRTRDFEIISGNVRKRRPMSEETKQKISSSRKIYCEELAAQKIVDEANKVNDCRLQINLTKDRIIRIIISKMKLSTKRI